jgi:hypothetical protein
MNESSALTIDDSSDCGRAPDRAVQPLAPRLIAAPPPEFAMLCDELGIPQPQWWRCDERPAQVPYPHGGLTLDYFH